MIKITYTDGTTETFTSPGKFLTVNTDDDENWVMIYENRKDQDNDDYDSDDDVLIAEIAKDEIRKIQYV